MFQCELQRLNGNDRLQADWRDLLNRVRPELRLFGPEWYSIWNRTIGANAPWTGDMQVATVYDEQNRLCGVMPIGHPKVGLMRVNAMGGYFQPWRSVLAEQAHEFAVGRALGWFLVEIGWSILQLGPWPMSHEAHRGVLSALNELEMPMQRQQSDQLAIAELPATWDECQESTIGHKFLREISRYENKLASDHRLELLHLSYPSATETSDLLAALAQVEQRSWLADDPRGRPRFTGAVEQRFWSELIQEWLAPQGFFDSWLLLADNQPISFVVAATVGSTRYVIANNYDEAWSQYRVGSQLYRLMFEEGYSRGVTRYDFGTNELHYKSRWGATAADRVDSFTVSVNHMVSGFWNAGLKLKSLFDGGLRGHPASHELLASGEPRPESAPTYEQESNVAEFARIQPHATTR